MTEPQNNNDNALLRFRRSLYVSLALACACLTFVEWWFLPEIVVLAALVAGVMIVAYRAESQWSLSLRAANAVGGLIALLLVGWAAYHFFRPQGTLLDYLPPQAAFLVYLGPLVMVLIPAKLLRPKHIGDYWSMQLIGLMTMALACALGGNNFLLVFVLSYAVAAVWCLTNFHSVSHGDGTIHEYANGTGSNIPRVGLWTAAAMALAIGLSLATPRNSDAQWGVGGLVPRATIGNADERPLIDLNYTGDLETSNEVAFVVRAETADHQPKLDLSLAQKWRGTSFNFYDQGKWANRGWPRQNIEGNFGDRGFGRGGRVPFRPQFNPRDQMHSLPDLGPKQYFLTFPYPARPRGVYYLAAPIWPPTTRIGFQWAAPVITETAAGPISWVALRDGEVFPPLSVHGDRSQVFYRQVTAPTPESGLSLPVVVDPALKDLLTVIVGMKPLREFSNWLMQQLVDGNQLPNLKNWKPGAGPPPVERHQEIALAMERYFNSSGRFEYNTQSLKRIDLTMDPVEDFLLNVRQGHCNRFATALALVLRAQGIPARIVLGYEGCEASGDGSYTVRQINAHSWVECLIRHADADGNPTWHWLTLDPSPTVERVATSDNAFPKWIENSLAGFSEFLRIFVMELNAERQNRAHSALAFLSPIEWGPSLIQFLVMPIGWATVSALAVGIWIVRRRRQPRSDTISNVYQQLRKSMAKAQYFEDSPGITPRELNRIAEGCIDDQTAVAAAQSIILFHRNSLYGGMKLNRNELFQMRSALKTVTNYCRRNRRTILEPVAA